MLDDHKMVRLLFLMCSIFLVGACQEVTIKKLELTELQAERLSKIQWDVLDALPAPPGCEHSEDSRTSSPCFLRFIERSIAEDHELVRALQRQFGDTLDLNLVIDPEGQVSVDRHNKDLELEVSQADLLSRISAHLSNRPWSPGIKRGIPVQVHLSYTLVLKSSP